MISFDKTYRPPLFRLYGLILNILCITTSLLVLQLPLRAQKQIFPFLDSKTLHNPIIPQVSDDKLDNAFQHRMDVGRLNSQSDDRGLENQGEIGFFPDTVTVYSISQNPARYSYFYSENGLRLLTIIKLYENEQWVNIAYESCTYDSERNLLTSIWQSWQNGNWQNTSKTTYTYYNNKLLTRTLQTWTSSGWTNFEKITNTYDLNGNHSTHKAERWVDNEWINDVYVLYFYDNQNNLTSGIRQIWNAVYWLNSQEYSYSYSSSGKLLLATIKNWEDDDWVNFYKETYSYTNNRLSEYIGMEWNGTSWQNSTKYNYTYTDAGFLFTAIGQQWASGQWQNLERSQYSYNTFGGILSGLVQNWASAVWQNNMLITNAYDENGNALSANVHFWDGSAWMQNQDALLELCYSNCYLKNYYTGYRATAHYISAVVGLPQHERKATISLFPNPAKESIHLATTLPEETMIGVKLFSSDGRFAACLYEGKAQLLPKQLSTEHLPNGIYFCTIQTQYNTEAIKIIINK